ncbi:TPA: Bro-N domain-containing protein [Clostridioides difficile]|uniref:BRO-N domain-containing protein n=3 Tax=Clostridioides difficile TaxID=1496 RepID=UPI00038C77A0|nr:Bro-N domain-containing protein [Clostridioides difficile]AXU27209.1 prophage antirepressor [Clostridioides difficile]EQE87462.1 BRO family, N-terminal domain protein [Clostridioides difficile CD69]KJF65017.1 toxin Bro [Clostridioides difficile]MBY1131365.1 Bro-N domain-containing protein [Clostridioides difficile]MBY1885563.1 Bro-N domain-containing protein [Clostridioides difficile]
MSNNLQVFKNSDFGEIRVIELNGEPWFVGKDVAETLGYKDTSDALKRHVDDEDKGVGEIPTPGGNQNMKIINESGLYSLILSSKLSTAKKFKHWVTRDVLPSIRKTGTYSTKSKDIKDESEIKYMNAQARLKNARAREAKIYLELADKVDIKEYKQIMYSKTTELISGEALIPLPKMDKKTYSATEIGKMLGISANKVGGLANAYNLKTEEYGIKVWDKAKHSNKQVPNFRYYENVIPILEKTLSSFEN